MLSGWTTDNHFFGQNFYLEPNVADDSRKAYTALEKITARILAHREASPA